MITETETETETEIAVATKTGAETATTIRADITTTIGHRAIITGGIGIETETETETGIEIAEDIALDQETEMTAGDHVLPEATTGEMTGAKGIVNGMSREETGRRIEEITPLVMLRL